MYSVFVIIGVIVVIIAILSFLGCADTTRRRSLTLPRSIDSVPEPFS